MDNPTNSTTREVTLRDIAATLREVCTPRTSRDYTALAGLIVIGMATAVRPGLFPGMCAVFTVGRVMADTLFPSRPAPERAQQSQSQDLS